MEGDIESQEMTGHAPLIVTFSGIDGAGKTTQIDALSAHLIDHGLRVTHVRFWDDVAFMPKLRAGVSLAVLQKPATAQQPSGSRNDKNVRTWYLTLVRAIFYLLDAIRLRRIVSRLRTENHDFVIFDRYLYDQLVQIRSQSRPGRTYIRILASLTPKPEFAFLLDASPDEAFARKSEYPLEFMRGYRTAFLALSSFVPQLVVIKASSVENMRQQILQCIGTEVTCPPSLVQG